MTRYVLTRCSCGRMLGINGNDIHSQLARGAEHRGKPAEGDGALFPEVLGHLSTAVRSPKERDTPAVVGGRLSP